MNIAFRIVAITCLSICSTVLLSCTADPIRQEPKELPTRATGSVIKPTVEHIGLSAIAKAPTYEMKRHISFLIKFDAPTIAPTIRFEDGIHLTNAIDNKGRNLAQLCEVTTRGMRLQQELYKGMWVNNTNPTSANCTIEDIPHSVDRLVRLDGYANCKIPTDSERYTLAVSGEQTSIEVRPGATLSARVYRSGESGPFILEVTLDRSADPTWHVGSDAPPQLAQVLFTKGNSEMPLERTGDTEAEATPTGWTVKYQMNRGPKGATEPWNLIFLLVTAYENHTIPFHMRNIEFDRS